MCTYRFPARRRADIHNPILLQPDPQRQGGIQQGIQRHRSGGVIFGALEAELVVPGETGGGDKEGGIAQGQAHVSQGVGLLELEGVQVIGDGIIGGVLEVCCSSPAYARYD